MSKRGFTLIELLVVASIGVIIATAGLVSYTNTTKKSRDAKRKADIEQIRSALEMYRADNGIYPLNVAALSGYINTISLSDPQGVSYWISLQPYEYCVGTEIETVVLPGDNVCGAPAPNNYSRSQTQ